HAILYKNDLHRGIGLIIIDEQHRFGVSQRFELIKKATVHKITPHVLTVSATPIPRSLALILHGSLDLSVIDELPKGRIPVITRLITDSVRIKAYEWLGRQISTSGMQIFVVCPLIDDSETDKSAELKSVSSAYEELKKAFPTRSIEIIHSKLKNQQEIIEKFRNRTIDILVATTVVEVGVDIPNATCMVVENADRFGLAQLHQLRGRVGRGSQQSYCLLFSNNYSEVARRRLTAMTEITNGFKLAELDLEIRGPGVLLGTTQHGFDSLVMPHLFNAPLLKRISEIADLLLAKNGESSYTTIVPLYLN
ncbi:MAG: helicase-related protein, partial [Patescibacteria group bacterium]